MEEKKTNDDLYISVLDIGLLEVNLKEKSVQVDDEIHLGLSTSCLELISFFKKHNFQIPRNNFQELYRQYRTTLVWKNAPITNNHRNASSTLMSIRNRALVKCRLIVVCRRGIFYLKKIDPKYCFKSFNEYPTLVHSSVRNNVKIYRFRDGIDFRDLSNKAFSINSRLHNIVLTKTLIYFDEKGCRHKYYALSELKRLIEKPNVVKTPVVLSLLEAIENKRLSFD